jgi:hypothetical protein
MVIILAMMANAILKKNAIQVMFLEAMVTVIQNVEVAIVQVANVVAINVYTVLVAIILEMTVNATIVVNVKMVMF